MKRAARLVVAIAGIAVAILASPIATSAQSYPARPIRILLGSTPGTGPDIVGRILAESMAGGLGQPVIVENRPGASGTIAAQLAARASADGHTMLLGTAANLAVAPHLLPSARYDPMKAFTPVGLIQRGPYVIAVYPAIPARNLPEFITHAKSNPGKLDFGTPGTGSAHHVAWELFMMRTGTQLVHIPYKGGAQAIQDTIAGRIAVFMASPNSRIAQFVEAGKLRYIAVTGAMRIQRLPSVPTVSEQGVPGFEAYAWWGVLMPAGAPREAVARINSALNTALDDPGIRKRLRDQSVPDERFATTPQEFGAWIAAEHARWGKVIRDARIRIK
jgi:tripartite-type tricarboxylate transporter receptor subunit TctC